jgi:hypothetical protein
MRGSNIVAAAANFGLGVTSTGAVYGVGSSAPGVSMLHLAAPIVGLSEPAFQDGYYLVGADGGVFTFGIDVSYEGSMAGQHLSAPIVGIAATGSYRGYWLVGADGGVFAFGDAAFDGSMGGQRLNASVVGIVPTRDDAGYWLVASDGGVFAFGDAGYFGSMGGQHLDAPIVSMAGAGDGYWLVGRDGGIFTFGDAFFNGSFVGQTDAPVISISYDAPIHLPPPTVPPSGYSIATSSGQLYSATS